MNVLKTRHNYLENITKESSPPLNLKVSKPFFDGHLARDRSDQHDNLPVFGLLSK
jgi:hypothetical protein